jgi:hypothetical protein
MPLETFDLRALRQKIEAVEGTAETLAGADAVQIMEGSGQIQTDELERNLDRPAGGARPYVQTRRRVMVTGMIELAGSATAGNASPLSTMLRNCGHTETLNAGPPANAEYTPVLSGFPSSTIGFYHAGELLLGVGCRGRLTSIDLAINDYPKAGIELMGKVQAYSEVAVPSDDLSAFQEPIVGVEANMAIELGGVALEAVSLSLDPGVSLALAYHTEATISRQSARAVTGTLRVYRPLIATADIRSMAAGHTKQALLVDYVTGTAAKDLSLEAPSMQIGEPQNVDIDGLRGWDIPVRLLPDAGNDDYTLRFGSRT